VAYLFFLLSGILAFFSPSKLIESTLVEALVYAWAFFLVAGGALCLGGKARNNWGGEIIGLPLLSAACSIFGVVIFVRGTSSAAIAVGGIFCGFTVVFLGRWLEVRKLAKVNHEVNSER
jgi:hypothetical protein